jgi:23S rRNA (adenine2503-C2)-methyltransferase
MTAEGAPAEPRPLARELDRLGLEKVLFPQFSKPPRDLAEKLSTALYRDGALYRDEVISRVGLGRDRARRVERALRLEPLLEPLRQHRSESDGAERMALRVRRLPEAPPIEAVTIPRRDQLSLCVSSQVGCALRCAFCATGHLGLHGNLTAGEIVEQHSWAIRTRGLRVGDVVFMGMGEPLLNYDAVLEAAQRLTAREGAQVSARRILISTAGIVPAIRRFARESHPFQLLFSLTSAIPEKRTRLMPIELRYPLDELRDAMCEYQASRRRNRHVTLEYTAIPGVNLAEEDVDALQAFVEGIPVIVDVIPYNATPSPFRPPSWGEVKSFTTALRRLRVPVKIRYSAGKQIAAGCGQLAADEVAAAPASGHMTAPAGIFSDSTSTAAAGVTEP